jgi:DNA methyltransferase 1-associated protein 1
MVFRYDEEEWADLVPPDAAWTREETDYLLDLCAVYQLRFLVIADRYDVRAAPGSQTLAVRLAVAPQVVD